MTDLFSYLKDCGIFVWISFALAIGVIPCALTMTYYAKQMKTVHVILAFAAMESPFFIIGLVGHISSVLIANKMARESAVNEATQAEFLEMANALAMRVWHIPVAMFVILGLLMAISITRSQKKRP